jgi:NADP-dependent 3-hydroxy acid dehydrogenase YdfG
VGAYDIDEDGLATLADEIRAIGGGLTGHLDVTDADEMSTRVTEFAQANGNRLAS